MVPWALIWSRLGKVTSEKARLGLLLGNEFGDGHLDLQLREPPADAHPGPVAELPD